MIDRYKLQVKCPWCAWCAEVELIINAPKEAVDDASKLLGYEMQKHWDIRKHAL